MSFDFQDIQVALADSMFNGDFSIAGIAIFTMIVLVVFAAFIKRNPVVPFVAMLCLAVMFTAMGLLPTSLTIILALVSVLVIAAKAKEALRC